jgi:hypothetical protein
MRTKHLILDFRFWISHFAEAGFPKYKSATQHKLNSSTLAGPKNSTAAKIRTIRCLKGWLDEYI